MEKINLKAKTRAIIGKKAKTLRNQGIIPLVLYGQGKEATNLEVNLADFLKAYKKAGRSSLIDLTIDDKSPIKIIVKNIQKHPVTEYIIHADLYKIKMDEKITANIPIKFTGEAPAVKELEGNLITSKDNIEVECLPGDLIHEIEIDVSVLKTFDDVIHVKDIKLAENIEVLDEPEDIIAMVTPPRSEEELEAMDSEAAADSEKAQIEKMEAEAEAEKATEGEEKSEDNGDKKAEENK